MTPPTIVLITSGAPLTQHMCDSVGVVIETMTDIRLRDEEKWKRCTILSVHLCPLTEDTVSSVNYINIGLFSYIVNA